MSKRWVLGIGVALAVVALAGTGFAAFTATATVNGRASAGSVELAIVSTSVGTCQGFSGATAPGVGNYTFSGLNEQRTAVTVTVTNLTPSTLCYGYVELENTGSVPVNLSAVLQTPGVSGLCAPSAYNCYDVATASGLEASGYYFWSGTGQRGPTSSVTNIVTIAPGATYTDVIGVGIPGTSTNATPSSATFSIVYTASAGY